MMKCIGLPVGLIDYEPHDVDPVTMGCCSAKPGPVCHYRIVSGHSSCCAAIAISIRFCRVSFG